MFHFIKQSFIIAFFGTLLLAIQLFAFTEPTVAPPGGNTPAPLNESSTGQSKAGGLILNTGGATNGLIVQNGNVGIGTANPQAKLEVNGQIKITGGTPGAGKVLTSNASGLATWETAAGGLGGGGTINYVGKFTGSGTIGNSQIFDNGTNVGIGTEGPGAKLDVGGGVKVANDTGVCNASKAGTIRWTGMAFQGCTGTAWTVIVGVRDGTSQTSAGRTCKQILDDGLSTGSGTYWIDPDNDGNTSNAFQAYCDMVSQGGGWTLVAGIEANTNHINTAAVTSGNLTSPTGKGKYSDTTINQIKLGASPAYRLTCAAVTAYFQTSCTFAATTDASGACTAEAYTYPPTSYGTAQFSQSSIKALADGSSASNDRLLYGGPLAGCDTAVTGWGQSGTVYVR